MAALGAETPSGDFEVLEFCFAGLPVQPKSTATEAGEWVAIASGLEMGAGTAEEELKASMLSEWLTGELGGDEVRVWRRLRGPTARQH